MTVWYSGGLDNLRLMLRHTGVSVTTTRDLVYREGGTATTNITAGCWADDAPDAFPTAAPPGPLTGQWTPSESTQPEVKL